MKRDDLIVCDVEFLDSNNIAFITVTGDFYIVNFLFGNLLFE